MSFPCLTRESRDNEIIIYWIRIQFHWILGSVPENDNAECLWHKLMLNWILGSRHSLFVTLGPRHSLSVTLGSRHSLFVTLGSRHSLFVTLGLDPRVQRKNESLFFWIFVSSTNMTKGNNAPGMTKGNNETCVSIPCHPRA